MPLAPAVTAAVTKFPWVLTVPIGSCVVLAAFQTAIVSLAPLLVKRTTTLVEAPVQPARMLCGSITSLNV